MGPEGSLQCSEESAARLSPEPQEFNKYPLLFSSFRTIKGDL
jgi:hypothetical protein